MTHLILPVGTRDHTLGATNMAVTLVEYGHKTFRAVCTAGFTARRPSTSTVYAMTDTGMPIRC